jgi:hypothetical protein
MREGLVTGNVVFMQLLELLSSDKRQNLLFSATSELNKFTLALPPPMIDIVLRLLYFVAKSICEEPDAAVTPGK